MTSTEPISSAVIVHCSVVIVTEPTTISNFHNWEHFWCMFPYIPVPVLLPVPLHALHWNIPQRINFWACFPLDFRSGACCVQTFYVSYTILCLIMPVHVSSVQWRTDDWYCWRTLPLVIMRTSSKLAALLQMLHYPYDTDASFKTEHPFYLSIQLLLLWF